MRKAGFRGQISLQCGRRGSVDRAACSAEGGVPWTEQPAVRKAGLRRQTEQPAVPYDVTCDRHTFSPPFITEAFISVVAPREHPAM